MKALRTGILMTMSVVALASELFAAPAVECGAQFGTQFNLEPATNAVAQQMENVDFIPNRVGLNEDLVVAGAYDFRGNAPAGTTWDGSLSGYYVHRSTTPDCSPQFEGGLPPVTVQGKTFAGDGGTVIAADPARDAFLVADVRLDLTDQLSAIGLFRASSANLLNPAQCPDGTHTAAQAQSCWEQTAPALINQIPSSGPLSSLDYPSLAADERGSGLGAGDVYVAYGSFAAGMELVACNDATLVCSSPLTISDSTDPFGGTVDAHVEVRPDGIITVTYLDQDSPPTDVIKFVSCKPAGAPNAPICGAPAVVATENQALGFSFSTGQSISGLNLLVLTFPKHANRIEADGKTVTTFVVWDRCKTTFNFILPAGGSFPTCLDADVVMSTSTDGATWSPVTPVNGGPGHQFFPSISTDESRGVVIITYYDASADPFGKRLRVSLNHIDPGSTKVSPVIALTTLPTPWDADPSQNPFAIGFDFHFGMKARGMGTPGNSRLYTSFTSTADRPGMYFGQPVREQNNNLVKLTY